MLTLTETERDAVIDLIIKDLLPYKALDLFEEPESRRRLADYAEIADELEFDGPRRQEYPIERSLPALRRVLTEWRDIADQWLEQHADAQERRGATEGERVEQRETHRLELWATCEAILARVERSR